MKTEDHTSGDSNAASATDGTVSDRQPLTAAAKWEAFRETAQRKFKLYMSASRLTLGQGRWVAAASLMGALSLGLLTAGIVAATGSYNVETASLTAEKAPQIIASTGKTTVEDITRMADTGASEDGEDVAAADTTDTDDRQQTAALNDEAETASASLMPTRDADETGTPSVSADDEKTLAELQPAAPQKIETTVALKSGETLMELLMNEGAGRVDAYHAVAALRSYYNPRKLRAGQEIKLAFLNDTDETATQDDASDNASSRLLTALSLEPDIERTVKVMRDGDGSYTGNEIKKTFTESYVRAKGTISSSLFLDADRAGVPPRIIVEMIRMFSYSVDFQREIRAGDKFDVYFDRKFDENGVPVMEGNIAYASLTVGGKQHQLWRFKTKDGVWDYFDGKGRSMKKFLMRTPIDGARISSGFGLRRHPVLGYSKMHKGTDFAAPRGTPIYAAGNGVIEIAGWVRGFGNYIRIKHANSYETAYGHMNGFAKGIKRGTRVHQGQVIGYVGTTGRSTGPHLHYEVHVHGKAVNPLGIKLPTGTQLAGAELKRYQAKRSRVETQMAAAPVLTTVAQASPATVDDTKAN
ncbi:peptidoglycan DD-metalloendopeptidase family protein [uncultured Parvibaculum sp.]|uniref:M23 family metallopeptidase n=1 Tax=uncultured Parvibaculum sp. TaxID=291828 RepID=UPI0030DB8548